MLQPLTNQPLIAAFVALLSLAMVADFRTRRIPNRLLAYGLIIGLVGNTWISGWTGFLFAISGSAVGLLCLLPFYATGAMGAGDAKLMAMCGAFLGPVVVVAATAIALLAGGLIGVALFWHNYVPAARSGLSGDANDETPGGAPGGSRDQTIPFAFAIAAGVLVSIVVLPQISDFFGGVS